MRISLVLALALTAGAGAVASAGAQPAEPATVRIGVLSLFHPRTLTLSADHPITLFLDGSPHTLPAYQTAALQALNQTMTIHSGESTFTARTFSVEPTTFTLAVPGKLTRIYLGELSIQSHANTLVAVVAMPTELAVASIVAAESPPNAPLEALKAQAIASRSFLLGTRPAHPSFDACDTTHCQFLRSPPPAAAPASLATLATRNQALLWPAGSTSPRIVPAMYSRSCGGQTRTHPTADPAVYPFYSVRCEFCLRHPEVWSHAGTNHRVGLCQLGAVDLARRGATYSQILSHYFPNTTVAMLP